MGERLAIILGCAFPGAIWNVTAGQNGYFTAALLGGMLVNLRRRPLLAGVFLGLAAPVILIPRERYIVDMSVAPAPLLYETLEAPPLRRNTKVKTRIDPAALANQNPRLGRS